VAANLRSRRRATRAKFASPPSEYSSQFDWGFSDKLTREAMAAILDHAKSLGVMGAFVEPKVGNSPYLSAGYFQAVKILVEEARKRDMHLWFDDDGGYPSGFAGGKFTNERPDLRMQALASPSASPSPPASSTPTSSMLEPSAYWLSTSTVAPRRCSTVRRGP